MFILIASFLHEVSAELRELSLVCYIAELSVVHVEELTELPVGTEAAVPEVLAEDVSEVGQVLDPHHSVVLYRHLVQYEVVPVLHRADHGLLHLPLDVALHLRLLVAFAERSLE